MELIHEMRQSPTETGLLFDKNWQDAQTIYGRYRPICEQAGLTWVRRKSGLHKMRVTVATMLEANGDDATKFLMHSTRRTTEQSYIDAAQVLSQKKQVGVNFNPESKRSMLARLFKPSQQPRTT